MSFIVPLKRKTSRNSLHLIETPPRFLQRSLNTKYSTSLLHLKAHELCDHNATIPKQLTEPRIVSEQIGTRAESSDRTDKCFLPLQQTGTFHILGTQPSARLESPLQAIRSLITDCPALLKCHGAPKYIKTYFSESTYIIA